LVLDNLSEAIRPRQTTDYHWLKIQSTSDDRFWYEVKATGTTLSKSDGTLLAPLGGHLDGERNPLATADAHRDNTLFESVSTHRMEKTGR
jgi:hypothetical protein